MNDYSYLLYSEKSVLATDCYDLTPLTYEERGNYEKRGMLSALTLLFPLKTPPKQSYPLSWRRCDRHNPRKRVSSRNPFSRYCFLAESFKVNRWTMPNLR
ncbi:MAG: hypothetical protein EWV54_16375 [Microcystis novacekii Mn_MB_F_20050700_S1D]|uniref:Uncharacterized protein n=1 Tax=Microcystis novacekii Mn_MB_F_20050700_S1D TaxID=2486266 RepID=A0A552IPC3_9CHRO|nr:MAG: hypothetical protein EWV54_16375 [Microcystis novacekii Mn_MB_F_20050700_S1D]